MTDDELKQLQQSYTKLKEETGRSPAYFYDALFRHAPELRKLFREDLEGQGMKFMTTLGVIIARLNDESAVAPQFQQLGKTHASLGVLTDHFAPMEEALIDTLRHALGKEMTLELEAMWRTAFKEISVKMIERGEIPGH
ncbi:MULTISPECIES: globin domain-containing protein [unclassified Leisingera]|uniref:globin domain-containing protein n=1 Tax=unclassified Leisingera TaxID=2614906 RepID=UPI00031F733C|nr:MULTISPECIES: globin domain-containing protein [unclassified Leisingera]KIC26540.1 globin [Leisingera sp. ANG-S3]KIC53768.1 globin [Leisingera sp. ANG-S]KID10256.1 globin [Leisingera sp. ANG1]